MSFSIDQNIADTESLSTSLIVYFLFPLVSKSNYQVRFINEIGSASTKEDIKSSYQTANHVELPDMMSSKSGGERNERNRSY